MKPGERIGPGLAEVVGHEVDEVDRDLHLAHLGLGQEVREGPGGEREQVAPAARGSLRVEPGPQVGHERGVARPVLRSMRVPVAGKARVLPVDVEPVEVVAADELHGARDEAPPPFGRERRVGEAAGPGPAANRDQDLELRVLPPQSGQHLEVLAVAR
jgi:hypothetical protein